MRLFIAIDMESNNIKESIIKKQREIIRTGINGKAVNSNQFHFTLIFLGEVSNLMLESIKEKVKEVKFEPVNVRYKGVGVFPNAKNARIIWIGVDEQSSKELAKIAKSVEANLAPLGFKNDKEFTPHITIIRIKDRADCTHIISNEEFGEERLKEIKIKESKLTPSGPIYTDLFSIYAS